MTSLTSGLLSRLRCGVDVLVFNPPYVPTIDEEAYDAQDLGNLAGAWAGGMDGMHVTNTLLEQIDVGICITAAHMSLVDFCFRISCRPRACSILLLCDRISRNPFARYYSLSGV